MCAEKLLGAMLRCVDAHCHVLTPLSVACHAGSLAVLNIYLLHTYLWWKMCPHGSTQRLVCEALGDLADHHARPLLVCQIESAVWSGICGNF